MGRPPLLSDSELVCLAVSQALLGFHSEARWLRFARERLAALFPYLPQRSGYNKRLRAALPLVQRMIRELATDSDFWTDTVWITDSTPVRCGMSRLTVQHSNTATPSGGLRPGAQRPAPVGGAPMSKSTRSPPSTPPLPCRRAVSSPTPTTRSPAWPWR